MRRIMEGAIKEFGKSGNPEIVEWLCEKDYPNFRDFFRRLAKEGSIPILKWAREREYEFSEETFEAVMDSENLETLKWLLEQGCPHPELKDLAEYAARHSSGEVFRWIVTLGVTEITGDTIGELAEQTDLESLKFLRAQPGIPWTPEMTANLCLFWEALLWALDAGCPVSPQLFRKATTLGNIEKLKYLKSRGCPWDKWVCETASRNFSKAAQNFWYRDSEDALGTSDKIVWRNILEWAMDEGAPMGSNVMGRIASFGDSEDLLLFLKKGAPVKPGALEKALLGHRWENAIILLQHGVPIPEDIWKAEDERICLWLESNGISENSENSALSKAERPWEERRKRAREEEALELASVARPEKRRKK